MRQNYLPLFLLSLALVAGYVEHNRLLVLIAGCALLFRGWVYLGRRWPMLGWFLIGLINGLMGRGGRRW